MNKFGVGQAVSRYEDNRLTRGEGKYIADLTLENQTWACFVRSPHANARITNIDVESVESLPGVLCVLTSADLEAEGIGDVPCAIQVKNIDGSACTKPPRPALARYQVRYVGDAVAMIVAETRDQAVDAAEHLWVDYEMLDAVVETSRATAVDAPQIWEQAPANRCFHWQDGKREETASALQQATQVVELELINNRVIPTSIETRGAIASVESDTGRMVLHVACQGVHIMRDLLAGAIFKIKPEDILVKCDDVGGGFGMKIFLFPEYVALLVAARRLKRPIKWIAERSEAFVADSHGRDHVSRLQLALDADAKILALKVNTIANLGAYLSNFSPFVATAGGVSMLVGCYAIPAAHVEVEGVFTNTAPIDAYRGAGRPEAIYAIERLLDVAARELGIGPDEIRRRNFISPEAMPFTTVFGHTYDSGDFERNLNDAKTLANWDSFTERRHQSAANHKLRGIGLACYIERCGGGLPEQARLTVDHSGHVTLFIGTQSNGQGHETAFRQILSDRLGIAFDDVTIVQGDTDRIESGGGTMGSRSVPVGGAAIGAASEKIIERARVEAADMMESAVSDIEFRDGQFRIVGTDRVESFKQVAAAAANSDGISFDEKESFAPAEPTYPNGVHVCELEIDEVTAELSILNYTVVDDFGNIINPLLLEGQVHGGIAQGLGQALLEHCAYDAETGQLLSASFMDYNVPRADNLPMIRFRCNEIPCTTNPLGIKGAGEAGAIGAPPAIVNAIVNAFQDQQLRHVDMPVTQSRLFQLLSAEAA
ncbi:MAG: xanthine dehydrogenase family protein molybdopterin-binding subunit [Gammaproteobacteria bacterium]|nr:xanthine dehydrogenase family protein molybdopterin-binding subunit [Gammaproteobacteria bacterium]